MGLSESLALMFGYTLEGGQEHRGGAEYTIDVLMGNSWLTLLTTLWFT